MSFASTSRSWEWLARRDPLWAVLTDPRRKHGRWDVESFFRTGEKEIDGVLALLVRLGVELTDRSSALDFGCGPGRLSRALSRHFAEVHGVDVAPSMIARAREFHREQSSPVFHLNQQPDLALFPDDRFAFIYSSIVLQHISYPESLAYVREFIRVARPGGLIAFQTPVIDHTPRPLACLRRHVTDWAQRLRLPVPELYMEMNVIPEAEIARLDGCELVGALFTHTHQLPGDQIYVAEDPGERLVSKLFVLRKR